MENFLGLGYLLQPTIVVIFATLLFWIYHRQNYFKNLGIPYIKSIPFLGAFTDVVLGKVAIYDAINEIYNRPEVNDEPFFGIFLFHKPALVVNEPELIKKILVKDFVHFSDRYVGSDTHDPIGNYNLFMAKTSIWRNIRGKLSPFFSSGKLKTMYYLLDKISTDTIAYINRKLDGKNTVELDQKHLATLYSTDVIANCAYGVDANTCENPDGEFRKAGHSIFNMTFLRGIEFMTIFMLPPIRKLFNCTFLSHFTTNFIQSTIRYVMNEREKSGIKRNDLIDTLIELKKTDLTMDMLVAQAGVFFSAGIYLFWYTKLFINSI